MKLSDLHAVEGIDHQLSMALGKELEEEVIELRKKGTITPTVVIGSKLADIIKRHTNLAVIVTSMPGLMSYVQTPDIHRNNVILKDIEKEINASADSKHFFKEKQFIEGTVNLKTSYVTGDFARILCPIVMGYEYFVSKSMFTPEEAVAMLLHEVGHIFVYFEMLGRCTKTNYILIEGTKQLLTANTKEQRIVMLEEIEDALGTNIPKKEQLAEKARTEEAYRSLILSAAIQQSEQQFDVNIYNSRSWEQLADNFAARQGYSKALATILDKLFRMHGDSVYWKPSLNILVGVLTVLAPFAVVGATAIAAGTVGAAVAGGTVGGYSLHYLLTMENPLVRDYDPPKERILKLKQQINHALKDQSLTKEQKQKFVSDYQIVDKLLDNMHDNVTVFEFLWKTFIFSGRKQAANARMQNELEALLNNDLFTAAAILEISK